MASRKRPAPRGSSNGNHSPTEENNQPVSTETTGRYLVLLEEDSGKNAIKTLTKICGIKAAASSDFGEEGIDSQTLGGADGIVFEDLGVAVVNTPPDQTSALMEAAADEDQPAILAVEEERVVYALPYGSTSYGLDAPPVAPVRGGRVSEYLRGLQRGVDLAIAETLSRNGHADLEFEMLDVPEAQDTDSFTWGLLATRVATSRFSGRGIRIAVLDTGMDLGHPDFTGRHVEHRSFIPGQTVQDGNGHGTHCIGTSAGPIRPQRQPRYGIAGASQILAGKVLSNAGSGTDSGILAGIQWAIQSGASVISMSLGARVQSANQPFSQVFEAVGQRALAAGCLIVAAAGNDSRRPGSMWAVSHPANCPSFMAVAAVDSRLGVAFFSNAGLNSAGGKVDIAGPGVAVHSSWPRPSLYRAIDGTSMATPHVAGIAALIAEARPSVRGAALWQALVSSARALPSSARDVGAGLVQAPQ